MWQAHILVESTHGSMIGDNQASAVSNKAGGGGGTGLKKNVRRVGRLYNPCGTWLLPQDIADALASLSTTQHQNDVDPSPLPRCQTDRRATARSRTRGFSFTAMPTTVDTP